MTQVNRAIVAGLLSLVNITVATANVVMDGPWWVGLATFIFGTAVMLFAFNNANRNTKSTRNYVGQAIGLVVTLLVTFVILGGSLWLMGNWGFAVGIPVSIASAWFMESEFDKRFPRA